MKLKNGFPDYSWATFMDGWKCWYCEMNSADCLHHIMGRGGPTGECESSIFNAAPLCNNKCHIPNHGKLTTDDWKKIFAQKTFDYLIAHDYQFKEIDTEFILKYEKYYRRDQVSLARKSLSKQDIQRDALDKKEPAKEPLPADNAPVQTKSKSRRISRKA